MVAKEITLKMSSDEPNDPNGKPDVSWASNLLIKSPYVYFGGKGYVADIIWRRLGKDVGCYVEPFLGSGAVWLARPEFKPMDHMEHLNDIDGFIPNFWRAVQHDPEGVIFHMDYPQFECDKHARHYYLVNQTKRLVQKLEGDPDYYDAKIAGWWLWGAGLAIGGGYCSGKGPWQSVNGELIKVPDSDEPGITRNLINHTQSGHGMFRKGMADKAAYIKALQVRIHRGVRVSCGDWTRLLKPSVAWGLNTDKPDSIPTGILLDPPYPMTGRGGVYTHDGDDSVDAKVRGWALDNGSNQNLRIAYCTYFEETCDQAMMQAGWSSYRWQANGGYGNQGDGQGRANKLKEVIYFSPHCLQEPKQMSLF